MPESTESVHSSYIQHNHDRQKNNTDLKKCLKQCENDKYTLHTLNVKCLHLYVRKAESEAIKNVWLQLHDEQLNWKHQSQFNIAK